MTPKEIVTKFIPDKTDEMKTNEIVDAMDRISHDIETGEERNVTPEQMNELMKILGDKLTVKVSGAVNIRQRYIDMYESAKRKASQLSNIAKAYSNKIEQINNFIKYAMAQSGTKKIESEFYKVAYTVIPENSVDIFDEFQIPKDYQRVKTVVEPDKIKIKKAIKDGKVVAGARLVDTEKISIEGI